jgi:hypothetical protein
MEDKMEWREVGVTWRRRWIAVKIEIRQETGRRIRSNLQLKSAEFSKVVCKSARLATIQGADSSVRAISKSSW